MLGWLNTVLNACYSILTYSVNVGDGFSISVWNVFVFGIVGYLLLKLVFSLID